MDIVILGSGPNAPDAAHWDRAHFDKLVAINNARRVREDWDYSIYPEDFPEDRRVTQVRPGQHLIEADAFVPAQNAYGGFLYGGATMAYTAAYWALHALRPRRIGLFGCDMVYGSGCKTCHDQGMKVFPSDDSCLQCHDMAELAEQTKREGHDAKQNPHDSMHYGQEAPCMECHGEHTPKKAICMDCHNFDFPKFKYEHKYALIIYLYLNMEPPKRLHNKSNYIILKLN